MPTFQSVPMWRLTDRMVRSTLVTAWRLATSPTRTSPDLAKATTDGVVRAPSAFAMTVGSPPSRTATTEFVVPRSMPTARAMCVLPPCGVRAVPWVRVLPRDDRDACNVCVRAVVKLLESTALNLPDASHNGEGGGPVPGPGNFFPLG